jgi:uncharacterized protein (TIGR03437 family)
MAQAQTGIGVAGFGYRQPANAITAAPGQFMIVSVLGITTRIPNPIVPPITSGPAPAVQGITVGFVQGPVTVQVQIWEVQQSPCPASGACSPATTLTMQIPYELNPDSSTQAVLEVQENGAPVTNIVLNPVTDSVHVLNTCDQTGLFLSLASGLPADFCVPMVMHAQGPLVSMSASAKPGETLVVWAYGLGAIDHPMPEDCCSSVDQLPLAVQPFNVSLTYADAGRFLLRRLAQVVPDYVGMVGSGLYQVHFVVPAVPSDISPCSGTSGNLTVQVSGPNSADAAQLCMQP